MNAKFGIKIAMVSYQIYHKSRFLCDYYIVDILLFYLVVFIQVLDCYIEGIKIFWFCESYDDIFRIFWALVY